MSCEIADAYLVGDGFDEILGLGEPIDQRIGVERERERHRDSLELKSRQQKVGRRLAPRSAPAPPPRSRPRARRSASARWRGRRGGRRECRARGCRRCRARGRGRCLKASAALRDRSRDRACRTIRRAAHLLVSLGDARRRRTQAHRRQHRHVRIGAEGQRARLRRGPQPLAVVVERIRPRAGIPRSSSASASSGSATGVRSRPASGAEVSSVVSTQIRAPGLRLLPIRRLISAKAVSPEDSHAEIVFAREKPNFVRRASLLAPSACPNC